MSTILLENDKRIKNLFNTMFGTINLNNNQKIKFLLSTDEIRTVDMLNEITNVLTSKYNNNEVNNIFINHGIITDRHNPKFSILSTSNSLLRSLDQASFFFDSTISHDTFFDKPLNYTEFKPINDIEFKPLNYTELKSLKDIEYKPLKDTEFKSLNEPINKSLNDNNIGPFIDKPFIDKPLNDYVEHFNNLEIPKEYNSQIPKNYDFNNNELNNKLADLQNEIDTIKSKSDIECETKINTIKSELNNKITDIKNKSQDSIDNYIKLLTDILLKNQVITQNEVDNMNRNLKNGLIDLNTIVNYLENKKKLAKNLTINYNFDNIYLHKWNAPLPRPPICISDDPVKIKQIDQYSTSFSPFN